MTLAMDRIAPSAADTFEGIHNFRDFGGHRVPGGRVRLGALYRSAHYAEATDADLERFRDMGFHAIVDLRRPGEREVTKTRRHPECRAISISYGDRSQAHEPPHLAFLREPGWTHAMLVTRMAEIYRDFPYLPGHLQVFRDAFTTLADAPGPVVLHCHAGKDRTGVICALVLHMLGVGPDDIMTDYLRTNAESRIAERVPELAAQFRAANGFDLDQGLLHHVLGVDRSWLEAALDEIARRSGSLEDYVSGDLGISPDQTARLRERLIVRG
ncbi:MAG: tyrosine-protein phosphatase [Alphaproteobacteria bacterium]|nr:tyrosine-protein phosphatase [Alphaproteobacteria bacterium]